LAGVLSRNVSTDKGVPKIPPNVFINALFSMVYRKALFKDGHFFLFYLTTKFFFDILGALIPTNL
jgi:hypothetical protein